MVAGLHSITAGMQAQWQRHEVLANNLANISTPGFKRDDMLPVSESGAAALAAAGANVSLVGLQPVVQWTDFGQGPLRETGRDLDAAINGNGFFVVDTPRGPRYTRAGNFSRNANGYLATADGLPVLGANGPIPLRTGSLNITQRGEVVINGTVVDRLQVVDFPRPYRLLKEGGGLFVPVDTTTPPLPVAAPEVVGGSLESSNVNSMESMVSMIELLRAYEASQKVVQAVEETNQQATSDIGRVS
jgi:flagellar basal-body rod protein FlgF